ncbi:MAG TPA: aspartate kinase [Draconibacterium sp.]|nr:aspartate kinase [Draconibacterium sp.]
MSDRVIRFGGSSIGNKNSVNQLKDYLNQSAGRKLIVVSAIPELLDWVEKSLGQIFQQKLSSDKLILRLNLFFTDRVGKQPTLSFLHLADQLVNLLTGIALIGDYSPALKDQVISYSEKLSVEILLAQWNLSGNEISIIWPEEIELKATSDYGSATFLSVNTDKILALPEAVFLVPGTYGISKNAKTVRTGKSAADYTAAALTAFLGIEKLELWGLDNIFQKADPAIVENPPVIERLTYSEASELAYFDHYSFHPRTVEPLEHLHIPIQVLNTSTENGKIDTIVNTETFVDEKIVKSVACSDDISLLKLDGPGVGLKPGILAKVTNCLNDAGINIKSVITSQISINFILEKGTGDRALRLIQKLGFTSVKEIHLIKNVSLIGIIGHGMQQNYGVSAKIFNAVAQHKINVVLSGSGASDLVSYLVVKSSDKEKSVREIYKAFFEDAK